MTYSDILDFWYSKNIKKYWFASTSKLDVEIKNCYKKVWQDASVGLLDDWQNTPEGCLALVIVLDQLPLNMFRGQAKSFQTEAQAIEVAMNAINKGFDAKLDKDKLSFLFMPLMHSENIEHQVLNTS